MVFMLLSGKPEVTLLSFFIAVIVLITGRQYYTLIRYTIAFGVLYFYYYAVTHMPEFTLDIPLGSGPYRIKDLVHHGKNEYIRSFIRFR